MPSEKKDKDIKGGGKLTSGSRGGRRGSRENFLLEMTFELILKRDWGF